MISNNTCKIHLVNVTVPLFPEVFARLGGIHSTPFSRLLLSRSDNKASGGAISVFLSNFLAVKSRILGLVM